MKIIEFIQNIKNAVVDPTGRTQRQFDVLIRWAQSFFHGTFVGATGFGKSRVGLEAIKLLRRDDISRKVIVVVPTIVLKEQWEKLLISIKQNTHTEVYVINSIINNGLRNNCSLLILDRFCPV